MTKYVLKECLGNHEFEEVSTFEGEQADIDKVINQARADEPHRNFVVQLADFVPDEVPAGTFGTPSLDEDEEDAKSECETPRKKSKKS